MKAEIEIKKALVGLGKERDTLPEYSFFGDPNWVKIDAQIEALEWALEETDTLDEYLEE